MKRMIILGLVLFTSLASAAWAQQTIGKENTHHGESDCYDTFYQKWIDLARIPTRSATGTVIHPLRACQAGGQVTGTRRI